MKFASLRVAALAALTIATLAACKDASDSGGAPAGQATVDGTVGAAAQERRRDAAFAAILERAKPLITEEDPEFSFRVGSRWFDAVSFGIQIGLVEYAAQRDERLGIKAKKRPSIDQLTKGTARELMLNLRKVLDNNCADELQLACLLYVEAAYKLTLELAKSGELDPGAKYENWVRVVLPKLKDSEAAAQLEKAYDWIVAAEERRVKGQQGTAKSSGVPK